MDKKPTSKLPSTRSATEREVELHRGGRDAGGLIGRAVSDLSEEELKAFRGEAIREAIKLEVKQRDQEIKYDGGKRVIDDHVEAWKMLDQGNNRSTRHTVTTETEMGAGKMRIESKSGAQCFVATAAYGDADHPDVEFLRRYRDHVLAPTPFGRAFIRVYWRVGPKLASAIRPFPVARQAATRAIGALVARLKARDAL